jgi:hypothetical protein
MTTKYTPSDVALTEGRMAARSESTMVDAERDVGDIGEAAVRAAACQIKIDVLHDLERALQENFPFECSAYETDSLYLSRLGEARLEMMGEIITFLADQVRAEREAD